MVWFDIDYGYGYCRPILMISLMELCIILNSHFAAKESLFKTSFYPVKVVEGKMHVFSYVLVD